MEPEQVKDVLSVLCKKNILKIHERNGLHSYHILKESESNDKEDEPSESQNESSEENEEEEINIDKVVLEYENFEIVQNLLNVSCDLKEYIAYEVGKLRHRESDLLSQIREENKFLKSELKELRNLFKETFVQNFNNNFDSNYKNQCTEVSDEWKMVNNGPPRHQNRVINSPKLTLSNRFNDLRDRNQSEIILLNDDQANPSTTNVDTQTNHNKSVINDKYVQKARSFKSFRRPEPVVNQYPEREKVFGNLKNTSSTRKRSFIRILSDSIPKGLRHNSFNEMIHDGYAKFKCFPGAKISHLDHYSEPTLTEDKPDLVLLHVGINNILSSDKNSNDQIADDIIKIGKKCIHHGVEKVFISSIVKCSKVDNVQVNEINKLLSNKCKQLDFGFIDNSNILEEHLWKDGIHLKESGKVLLAKNFLFHINNFLYYALGKTTRTY